MTAEVFQDITQVPPDVLARLQLHLELLRRWNPRINLVSPASLADAWRRHFLDSAQLLPLIPEKTEPRRIVDFGTGAGFPGLVLAIMGAGEVHLFESDQRKIAFLREAARITNTEITLHPHRIEKIEAFGADVVTARAFAPLPRLLEFAFPFMTAAIKSGILAPRLLILKGKRHEEELTDAAKRWSMRTERFPSMTDPASAALRIEVHSLRDNQP